MKRIAFLLVLAILAGGTFISSCNKDDETGAIVTPSQLQLITSHGWRMSSFFIDTMDITSTIPTCDLDNIITFGTDSIYTEDEGATLCNPTDPQISSTGTWLFANNQTELITNPGTVEEQNYLINQLDANLMKLQSSQFDSVSSSTIIYRFTFIKN